jgi:crotonobetainyl-CoA:carnitine CoA-transferase CaiB-like acyl-CoA transferase
MQDRSGGREESGAGQPLSGLRVLELATGVAGPFTGKLFADYGADVIKVEPPGGDPSRHRGDDPEQSPLFLHLNANKRSIVADPTTGDGASLIREVAATCHLVIESFRPGQLEEWGLGYDQLRADRPDIVVVSVTGFGQTGPYAGWVGEEIVYYGLGGPMSATGLPEREPVKLAGNVVQYQCGSVAAVAALGALRLAEVTGRSVHVDVSNLETQAGSIDRRTAYLLSAQMTGHDVERETSHLARTVPAGIYPTADGYIQVLVAGNWIERMAATLGDDELARHYAAADWLRDPEIPDLLDAALYGWTLTRTAKAAEVEAQEARWGVTAVNQPLQVLDEEHWRHRGYWAEADHPVAGRFRQPGPAFRPAEPGFLLRSPAPLLDQHRAEVVAELGPGHPEIARPDRAQRGSGAQVRGETGSDLPLTGIRVLDLTVVWAGPYCTMQLADLGAEVIRLDNPWYFPTATRGAMPRPVPPVDHLGPVWGGYPDGIPGERPWNQVCAFANHARSKLGATVHLGTPEGRELALRLIERCDVLVENNAATTLDKLGLDWATLQARNPRLIMMRMPSLGNWGPASGYVGFGAHVEAMVGVTAVRGYPDVDPTNQDATYHMDPATGTMAAFAVQAVLRRRERTGRGELIELAQAETLMHHIGEYLVEADRCGTVHQRLGNRHPHRAPQGCYPCAGDDAWAVLSVGSDQEWAGLVRAMGSPAWAAEPRFHSGAGRIEHHDELDRAIGAWTATLSRHEVATRLQAEGVPAGPVLHESELLADPHLRERGFFRPNGSEDLPTYDHPGHLWRWDGPELAWGPISRLGADNDYVWRSVVGLDDQEWEAMQAGGHLSSDYLQADGRPY